MRTEPLIKWNVLPNRYEKCTALNDFKPRIKLSLQLALRTQHNVKSVVNEIVGWRQPVSNCGLQSVFYADGFGEFGEIGKLRTRSVQ